MKSYVFIEAMAGISKKDNPYHMLKLADPITFENHLISYDPNYISKKPDFLRGDKVTIEGELRTPYNNTQFVATSIKKAI